MNVYKIHFAYFVSGKAAKAGDVKVIAESRDKAEEAFYATHPDGSTFWYAVTEVEALSLSELF